MIEPLPDPKGGSEPAGAGTEPASAGALLRAARERQGLHLAVLAATIKVTPAKLEALENDRIELLPNATFARALAQSVCRSLKIDPRPVLSLLPQADTAPLEGTVGRLNTPFQDRPGRSDPGSLTWASKPLFWAGGLLLAAAVLVGLLPAEWVERWRAAPTVALGVAPPPVAVERVDRAADAGGEPRSASSIASSASASGAPVEMPAMAPTAAPEPGRNPSASSPAVAVSAGAALPPAPALAGSAPARGLRVTARSASWVEVLDGEGRAALQRIVQAGEVVEVVAPAPLKVKVGNVGGTELVLRGQPVDLGPYTRDNVARIELR